MVIKKIAVAAASATLVATMVFAATARPAYATKVDCDAVMGELNSGKKAKEVAKDLSISTSSVYRCKKHAKEAAKSESKSLAKGGKEVPSPAMAAPSAAASPAKK